MTDMVLLPACDRGARPWKNGRGTTQKVAIHPDDAGIGDFGWRLSIADVVLEDDFSGFPGVDRHLMVLSGRLSIRIGAEPPTVRGIDDPELRFAGEAPVRAGPLDGTVRDLNLMVRRDLFAGRLTRLGDINGRTTGDTTILVVQSPLDVAVNGEVQALGALDAIRLRPGAMIQATGSMLLAEVRRR